MGRGARARAIRTVVAEADAAFGGESLWPANDWDSWRTPTPLKTLSIGAAGVLWGLDAFARRRERRHSLWTGDIGAAVLAADCLDASSRYPVLG